MARISTRRKRSLGLTTSKKYDKLRKEGKKGAKTFLSNEKATLYAAEVLKLGEGTFSIVSAKKNKKFKIEIH